MVNLRWGSEASEYFPKVLMNPIHDLMGRASKKLRQELVELGFAMVTKEEPSHFQKQLNLAFQVMELLHAGSLVVDDIEDESKSRRGRPTLHTLYGIPIALNAGNWLYFWPLELVRQHQLPAKMEQQIFYWYHRTLLKAHLGQALDVGIKVYDEPQEKIYALSLASLELKTGSLTSLAILLGALIGGSEVEDCDAIDNFGTQFGIALQMFDDIGNLLGKKDPGKKWEDLRLGRPSWVWAFLAKELDADRFSEFKSIVKSLPETVRLEAWLEKEKTLVQKCFQEACDFLEGATKGLTLTVSVSQKMDDLKERLKNAYV
jgi:geranylgeranyl pyrophosphate synthase